MPRVLIMAMLAAVLAPISAAQMRGRPGMVIGDRQFRHFRSGGFVYPFFYPDYSTESTAVPAASPMVVERKIFQPERPTEPLLIEWHGDRFVRYGEAQKSEAPDYAEVASARAASSATSPELLPAVLVYRDGHREEVDDYVITRGVLYARGNGYSQATRNIQLSVLDLAATLKANQSDGVRFVLPAGPNEVVTRP
jgi:hypothetical protein